MTDEQQQLVDRLSIPRPGNSYPIRLGASFKSEAVGVGTHIHTVAYSFRPASTDLLQPAAMRIDAIESLAQLEFHNRRADAPASICLVGKHSVASKRECVLIFDEGEQCFVLEKIASTCRDVKKASHPFEPTLLSRASRKRTASSSAASTATIASSTTTATASPQKLQAVQSESAASQQQIHVRLNASSANDVKLTMSSQINRFLDDDDEEGDGEEEDESSEVQWNL